MTSKTINRSDSSLDAVLAKVADDRTTVVEGKILRADDTHLFIEYKGTERKIQWDRVASVHLANSGMKTQSTYLLAKLNSICELPVRVQRVQDSRLHLKTTWGQEITVPYEALEFVKMSVQNGRVQYLSDLTPMDHSKVTPFFDRAIMWQLDQSLDGKPIVIGETEFARGIAMHSKTTLHYNLAQRYERFVSTVGIDPTTREHGNVLLRIFSDDRIIFEQPVFGAQSVDVDIAIKNTNTLSIVADFGEGQDVGDRIHFGDARVVRSSSTESSK